MSISDCTCFTVKPPSSVKGQEAFQPGSPSFISGMIISSASTRAAPLLFPSPKSDTYLDPPAVARKMKTLLKRAGIDEIRFHDLRHTFATLSLQNGVNVKTLSHTLGHYSAGFTLDTYTHVTRQMQEDAARKIGGFMAATQG